MTPAEFAKQMCALADDRQLTPAQAQDAARGLLIEALRSLGYGEGCEVYAELQARGAA